jgi:hypothetical protein
MPIRDWRNRTGFLRWCKATHDARVAVATVGVTKPAQPRPGAHAVENLTPTEAAIRRRPSEQFPAGDPPDDVAAYLAFLAFFARRASRYFLIVAFGRSLCLEQTIPKTGAALLEQPGTGQS